MYTDFDKTFDDGKGLRVNRIAFVGPTKSGKTALIRALSGKKFDEHPQYEHTCNKDLYQDRDIENNAYYIDTPSLTNAMSVADVMHLMFNCDVVCVCVAAESKYKLMAVQVVENAINEMAEHECPKLIILITKTDLRKEDCIRHSINNDTLALKAFAEKWRYDLYEISTKCDFSSIRQIVNWECNERSHYQLEPTVITPEASPVMWEHHPACKNNRPIYLFNE